MECQEKPNLGLLYLPLELLEHLCQFVTSKSVIALSNTHPMLRSQLGNSERIWKRVCEDLGIRTWKSVGGSSIKTMQKYIAFWNQMRKGEKSFRVERTNVFLAQSVTVGTAKTLERLHLSSVIEDYEDDGRTSREKKRKVSHNEEKSLAFAINSNFAALAVSLKQTNQSRLMAWPLSGTNDLLLFQELSLDFEVPLQHIHVWNNYVVIVPFRSKRHKSSLLNFYDISNKLSLALVIANTGDLPVLRESPMFYKESGANRIISHGHRIVLVDCTPVWKVRVFEMTLRDGQLTEHLQYFITLSSVPTSVSNPYFGHDQKDGLVVLSFFAKPCHKSLQSRYGTILVTLNLNEPKTFELIHPEKVFSNFKASHDLEQHIVETEHYLVTSSYLTKHTNYQGICQESVQAYPVPFCLDAQARLFKFDEKPISVNNDDITDYVTRDWILNEAAAAKHVIVILLQVRSNRLVRGFDVHNLTIKWTVPLNGSSGFCGLRPQNRLFLTEAWNLIWLADTSKIVFISTETGDKVGTIVLPRYTRRENELINYNQDHSPFAQSGVGVYDVLPMDSKIIVVHDMERMSPLAFDTVCL